MKIDRKEEIANMLQEMYESGWDTSNLDENLSYDDILDEYNLMKQEYADAEDAMYPNGRDEDSEDYE